ncbi:substrate-binding domain-containing protein [Alphaproteobacteria bacterium]|nr:substrate-binding domain-containing protein [Alphaproteobacteria bacterium]
MRIGIIPKVWDEHFIRAGFGIKEASKELGVSVEYEEPKNPDSNEQINIIEKWVKKGINAIVVSANDPDIIVPAMKRAQELGIKTSTWNSDIRDGREYFLNQTSDQRMGKCIVDMMIHSLKVSNGDFLIITSSLKSPNQSQWLKEMKNYSKKKYPTIVYKHIIECNEGAECAEKYTYDYLRKHPNTKGIFCLTGNSTPGVINAVKKLRLVGKVAVTGIGVPPQITTFLKEGSVKQVALWKPEDLGYAAVHLAKSQIDGGIYKYKEYAELGRLGKLKIVSNNTIILGEPHVMSFKQDIRKYLNFIDLSLKDMIHYDEIINYFSQTATHEIICFIVMQHYYEETELSKHKLLDKISFYSKNLQKKTITTEDKYVDNAIAKGYLIKTSSLFDHRKILIRPSKEMIVSAENNFYKLCIRINNQH